ncbi:hypothetical protein CVS30_13900 [Arthrobacter psychrolactophilus]|uniref:Heavy metal transporter n=1 Tax=Arthrobacter psychrolactophilus TaxID=92442 RepID=A0A2V5IMA2_9MICC|nr:hypothetical protein [Arthrobacter psychrolactophilus]PYI37749.1 hypothetical protein CVS30_13900 [Arthrobacter psychrolactophilus]
MKSRAALWWLLILFLVIAVIIGGGIWVVTTVKNAFAPGLSLGCTASVADQQYFLALDQTENAALISSIAIQRGMPARAATIALATGMQESRLRNIDYGDLDSVGLFQQRPSQDWGTVEEIMDPVYSTNAFYDVLSKVPDYINMPINDAAQIVQRSGFPYAYAQHEPLSRAFASALTGQSQEALNCTLPPVTSSSAPDVVIAAAQTAVGQVSATTSIDGAGTTVHFSVHEAYGWMLAHWALANANQFGISQVSYDGQAWDRNSNADGHNKGWAPSTSTTAGQLTIVLPAATP